jgi:alpha-ketoglutarate-dependent taurine dioxygenase
MGNCFARSQEYSTSFLFFIITDLGNLLKPQSVNLALAIATFYFKISSIPPNAGRRCAAEMLPSKPTGRLQRLRGHVGCAGGAVAGGAGAMAEGEYQGVRHREGYPVGPTAFDGRDAVWSGRLGFEALPASSHGLSFRPLPARAAGGAARELGFGAEVLGLDLGAGGAEAALPELADALHRWGYLLLRRQGLSPLRHVALARSLAPLVGAKLPPTSSADNGFTQANLVPGAPEIAVLGTKLAGFDPDHALGLPVNNSVKGAQWPERGACSWHADGPAFRTVGSFTFIHMVKAPRPGQGGTTLYASGYDIYDALPPALRIRAEGARVRYIEDGNWEHEYDMAAGGMRRLNKPGEVERHHDHVHPLVVRHPVTGRKAVWAAPANVQSVEGMAPAESLAFIEQVLGAGIGSGERAFEHAYADGDVCISDDRCMMHSTTPISPAVGNRVLHRVGTELRAAANRKKTFQYLYDGHSGGGNKGRMSFRPGAEAGAEAAAGPTKPAPA